MAIGLTHTGNSVQQNQAGAPKAFVQDASARSVGAPSQSQVAKPFSPVAAPQAPVAPAFAPAPHHSPASATPPPKQGLFSRIFGAPTIPSKNNSLVSADGRLNDEHALSSDNYKDYLAEIESELGSNSEKWGRI